MAVVDTLSPALRVAATEHVRVAEAQIAAGAVAAAPDGVPGLDADCVRVQATAWRAVLDPDGAAPDERARSGGVFGSSPPGMAWSRQPVVGEDGALAGGDGRGRAQQLHDVLAVIIGLAARVADAPSLVGNAPTRVVSVKAEDLVAGRGVAFADGGVMSRSVGARRTT